MHDQSVDRAVVLGGGMAGLLAARVLSEKYADVVIVDRDDLIGVAGPRTGVPHGRHAHGLVSRGHDIYESLFPGLTQGIADDGVLLGDFNGSVQWHFNGQPLARSNSGLTNLPTGRPMLEKHVRQHVQAIPNVRFLERHDIVGLETTADNKRVVGARIQRREQGSKPEVLAADLVLDITGRGSRMPVWLRELGYEVPAEDKVKIDLAYTSRHYRLKRDPFGSDILIVEAATPAHPRGAFFYPLPGREIAELSLTGILGDHPPTDPEGFLAYTKSLPLPVFYDYVHDAEPVDEPVRFKFPASVWRRYDQLTSFPDGLLVMGDAVCSFNPIYAQGMTVAGLQTLTLRKHLQGQALNPVEFFGEIAGQIASPWEFSATADLGYAGVEGPRPPQVLMINSFVNKLQHAAVHDKSLTDAFLRVAAMVAEPASLLSPVRLAQVQRVFIEHPESVPPPTPPATA